MSDWRPSVSRRASIGNYTEAGIHSGWSSCSHQEKMQSTSRPLRILALTHDHASEGCTCARIITPLRALENRGKIDYEHVRILPWRLGAAQHVLRDLPHADVLWIGRARHSILL